MQKNKKNKKWSEEELELLTTLYPLYVSKKWKHISQIFRQRGFSRTEIECREKWINFLDPELNNNEWEESELERLYEIHDQVGTKWCVIQKYIGRTQNKIKNRFYGTLRNYVRFVVNYLQDSEKSFNFEIGKLSPKFLNDMYKAQNQFRFLNEEIKNTISQMRYKIDRKILSERIQIKKNMYERLKGLILKAFANILKQKPNQDIKFQGRRLKTAYSQSQVKQQLQPQPQIQHHIKSEEAPQEHSFVKQEEPERQNPSPAQTNDYYPFLNYPLYPFGFYPHPLNWK